MVNEKFRLTSDDFLFLDRKMLDIGYHKITRSDQKKLFQRLDLIPPREVTGRETTYFYTNHGYTAIVHTTYIEKEKRWREVGEDSGWVLIREGDHAVYFARPFKRTKGFIIKLLRYAWVTKWKVDHRHLCPECDSYMYIHRKKNTRQYFWICEKNTNHKENKPIFLSWDYLLPKKATNFIRIRRSYTERYKNKNKKEGIERTPAAVIRKLWIISNPENLA